MRKGLIKINKDLYQTEDGYTLKKKYAHFGKRLNRVNHLYNPHGEYIGMPSTIKDANKQIEWYRNNIKEGQE